MILAVLYKKKAIGALSRFDCKHNQKKYSTEYSLGLVPKLSFRASSLFRRGNPSSESLSLWERCPEGAGRALSVSFSDSSPIGGALGKTDCHTSDIGHWFAMTF